ncbi:MAG: hypothetical protein H0X17_13285, partial [Deltaproteobacteria bacterium]|nr:hypothetical protein [Deltaproteobacteria bacterium]
MVLRRGWVVISGSPPLAIIAAGWLVFVLYAYPGYMDAESLDQLMDSRVGEITDWHSATMTQLWRVLGTFVAGPFPMLAVQSTLLLGGAYALLRRVLAPRRAAVVACTLLLAPPVMAVMAVIWRDSQLAGFLLAGTALTWTHRRGLQLAGLALFVLGCAMREAAALAALPLLVTGFAWQGWVGWRRYAAALVAWVLVAIVGRGLEH